MKFLLSIFVLISLAGCITRKEIQAEVWMHAALPDDICEANPRLKEYGISRRLNDTPDGKPQYEFLPYCPKDGNKYIEGYISFNTKKFNDILDKELPEKKEVNE